MRGSFCFAPTLVRDEVLSKTRTGRSESHHRELLASGGHGFTSAGGAGYGQHGNPGLGEQEQSAYNGHFESLHPNENSVRVQDNSCFAK